MKQKKTLYGYVESAKLWYSNISNNILNKVYMGKQLTVCLYVDDFLCTCVDGAGLKWLQEELLKEYKKVNANFGRVQSYIGMR